MRQINLILVAAILVILAGVMAACDMPTPLTPEPTQTPGGADGAVSAVGAVAATEARVVIANQAFDPHAIIVATGATITWENQDTVNHTITSSEGWFDSGQVSSGDTFTWQANKAGTFRYHCDNHPQMEGVIIVLEGGAVAPAMFDGKPVDQVFTDSCGGCHGPHREGGTGPALIPGRLTSDDEFYFSTIKDGRPGTVMPGWGATGLSDEEIWALVGFIRSEPRAEEVQWEIEQVAASRETLVAESDLPDEPIH